MTRPAPAATIGAFRECRHGHAIAYAATLESTGPAVVARLIDTATAAGHAVESSPKPDTTIGAVDLLDTTGDILGDVSVPTEASWAWWVTAAELHPRQSDCPVCAPAAHAATYAHLQED